MSEIFIEAFFCGGTTESTVKIFRRSVKIKTPPSLHNAKAYVGRNLLKFIFMEDKAMKRKILTIKEAAQLIDGLTEYRIRQMCISGQLPCFMAGKKYLIAEENLYRAVFGENYERKDGDVA